MNFFPANKLPAVGIHNKPDTAFLEIGVHFLVVNHLAQQKDAFCIVLAECPVADLNRVFDTITKSEMPCDVESDRTEVQNCGTKILLAMILESTQFLNSAGNG